MAMRLVIIQVIKSSITTEMTARTGHKTLKQNEQNYIIVVT